MPLRCSRGNEIKVLALVKSWKEERGENEELLSTSSAYPEQEILMVPE